MPGHRAVCPCPVKGLILKSLLWLLPLLWLQRRLSALLRRKCCDCNRAGRYRHGDSPDSPRPKLSRHTEHSLIYSPVLVTPEESAPHTRFHSVPGSPVRALVMPRGNRPRGG